MVMRKQVAFRKLLLTLAVAGLSHYAHAASEVVEMGKPLARFSLLKEGTHHYLRFMRKDDVNTALDIWTRVVSFEPQGRFRIRQRWDAVGAAPSTKWLDSYFEMGSFRPLTHQRITEKDGKRVVEGFLFAPDKVTGLPELADNTQNDLAIATPEPTFNFETNMEMLQALPLAEGYEAQINFYHGGGPQPARYTFKVAGSQTMAGPGGPVDCWVVTTDYNRPGSLSRFWFAKATQLMLRQEGALPDGRVLVKTLIDRGAALAIRSP
jgi:hypothetical protein